MNNIHEFKSYQIWTEATEPIRSDLTKLEDVSSIQELGVFLPKAKRMKLILKVRKQFPFRLAPSMCYLKMVGKLKGESVPAFLESARHTSHPPLKFSLNHKGIPIIFACALSVFAYFAYQWGLYELALANALSAPIFVAIAFVRIELPMDVEEFKIRKARLLRHCDPALTAYLNMELDHLAEAGDVLDNIHYLTEAKSN